MHINRANSKLTAPKPYAYAWRRSTVLTITSSRKMVITKASSRASFSSFIGLERITSFFRLPLLAGPWVLKTLGQTNKPIKIHSFNRSRYKISV